MPGPSRLLLTITVQQPFHRRDNTPPRSLAKPQMASQRNVAVASPGFCCGLQHGSRPPLGCQQGTALLPVQQGELHILLKVTGQAVPEPALEPISIQASALHTSRPCSQPLNRTRAHLEPGRQLDPQIRPRSAWRDKMGSGSPGLSGTNSLSLNR